MTSFKCPNFQRAITPEKFDGIRSKATQVIYSSFLLTSLKCQNFQRTITPEKIDGIHSKVTQVNLLIILYQLTKFKYFLRNLAEKFEMPKFAKGHNSGNS